MYIAIDIGGSHTRIAMMPVLDAPDVSLIAKFPTQQNYEQQLRAITDALQSYVTGACAGVGVSIGGRIAGDGRSVLVAPICRRMLASHWHRICTRNLALPSGSRMIPFAGCWPRRNSARYVLSTAAPI